MSEGTMEPRTFEDLWLMRETSKEWFDGQLRYENVRKGAAPEVGAVDSVSWHVVPTSDRVRVNKYTHVICDAAARRSAPPPRSCARTARARRAPWASTLSTRRSRSSCAWATT